MINKDEVHSWMRERMALGYSFRYIKGLAQTGIGVYENINVEIKCIETGEYQKLIWYKDEIRQ